jgi:UDP-GlcNAc:undecaprenyl-phosphate GlcNAc-1-phosphate transferase
MNYLIAFLIAFFLSLGLTWCAKTLGTRFSVVSIPRPRDIHKNPIPRIGGAAIFISFLVTSFIAFLYLLDSRFGVGDWFGIDKHLAGIWFGGLIIVLSMLLDDIRGLRAWQKLVFQLLAALVVISSGVGINSLSNPFGKTIDLNAVYIPILKIDGITYHFSLWSDLLSLIWLVGMMNVINFVDGVDGLAAGITGISATVIFFLSISLGVNQPATAMLSIILAGAAVGFLVWNFPPAKIFMGDSGSMFFGYILAVIAIISGGKLATAFLVLGFPIIDGLLVAGGRILRHKNPFTTPDKTHLHHRFLQAGFSARQSIIALYLVSAGFGFLALHLKTLNKMVSAFILILILIILIKLLNIKSAKQAGRLVSK